MAMREDWMLVRRVLDYRNAQAARDLFNAGPKGFEQLAKSPGLVTLMLEMTRAQTGNDALSRDQMMAGLQERVPSGED
jgi:hypothetical protein